MADRLFDALVLLALLTGILGAVIMLGLGGGLVAAAVATIWALDRR